jgi:hypothetical protein
MTDEATPLYCNAFRALKRRAENGHEFTVSEIEEAVEADPPTRRALAEIAAETRAGRDVTVAEVARRCRMPDAFVVMLVGAFVAEQRAALRSQPQPVH